MHFLQCKFTLRKNLKDFSELVLTYGRPSKKCNDFMKNFPKNFDPIFGVAVVKLRFHVAVAVAVTVAVAVAVVQTTARRGMVVAKNYLVVYYEKKRGISPTKPVLKAFFTL